MKKLILLMLLMSMLLISISYSGNWVETNSTARNYKQLCKDAVKEAQIFLKSGEVNPKKLEEQIGKVKHFCGTYNCSRCAANK